MVVNMITYLLMELNCSNSNCFLFFLFEAIESVLIIKILFLGVVYCRKLNTSLYLLNANDTRTQKINYMKNYTPIFQVVTCFWSWNI